MSDTGESAKRLTADDFIESIDPGLLTFKNELYVVNSVTSEATLRFLRPREVYELNIPDVYKRLLVNRIINLQTPETKQRMKNEELSGSPTCRKFEGTTPKQLFSDADGVESSTCNVNVTIPTSTVEAKSTEKSPGYLDSEMTRLSDVRDSLSILLLHKKDEIKYLKSTPTPPKPLAIPGGAVTKTICDNCHHRGHKAYGNKGNLSCPYESCVGYHFCGISAKHREFKQEVSKAEKEICQLEKELKANEESLKNMKAFITTNRTDFISTLRPKLQAMNQEKYRGKNGNQDLQKDLRLLQIATKGKIPEDIDTWDIEKINNAIRAGKAKVSYSGADFTVNSACVEEPVKNVYQANQYHNTMNTPNFGFYPWMQWMPPSPFTPTRMHHEMPQYTAPRPSCTITSPEAEQVNVYSPLQQSPYVDDVVFPALPPVECVHEICCTKELYYGRRDSQTHRQSNYYYPNKDP